MSSNHPARSLRGRNCRLDLCLPAIMGVLNLTPDSFSDGGCFSTPEQALRRGLEMQGEGAALIDIGGESTRPGALAVSVEEELSRVIPVILLLRRETELPISIDTTKARVAREALAAGANFINDISGLSFDAEMARVAAESGAGVFVMHTRGRPQVMQQCTRYQDLFREVMDGLQQSLTLAREAGVADECLAVDPGIGFGKSAEGNLELLKRISELHSLGCPILLGTSRKSFLGRILQQEVAAERLAGTLATVALGVEQGVQLLRVHDVRPAREAALVAWAIREQQLPFS